MATKLVFDNQKWAEIPFGKSRIHSQKLLELSDTELLAQWNKSRSETEEQRGWYRTRYQYLLSGKSVLDIGCGLGYDSISFAQYGTKVTFVDIVEDNIEVVRRICSLLGINNASFLVLKRVEDLQVLPCDYDTVTAIGSLHHTPFKTVKSEVEELVRHLKAGGRWLQFTYPKVRWMREGMLPFWLWGKITDGLRTPWAEWYDTPKLLSLLKPAKFEVVFYTEFYRGNYNWFDLRKIE